MPEEEKIEYEGFEKELQEYLAAYEKHLARKYTKATVDRHSYVIGYCIGYLCAHQGVQGFEDIKFSHISSKVYYDFISHTQEPMTRKAVFNIIRKYFEFVKEAFGVYNPKLMKSIAKV